MSDQNMDRRKLARKVWLRLGMMVPVWLIVFMLPAGTLAYWQAWLYLAILIVPMVLAFVYFLKHDPELLERRMRTREQRSEQRAVIKAMSLFFIVVFLVPGFDQRFGWSSVPVAIVLVTDLVVLLAYGLFLLVLRENSYAARTIAVDEGQKVIDTGPYAIVRHPMYVAVLVMYGLAPLALDSYWALIPAAGIVPLLVWRIVDEEKALTSDLAGYAEYCERVRYRLIPRIW